MPPAGDRDHFGTFVALGLSRCHVSGAVLMREANLMRNAVHIRLALTGGAGASVVLLVCLAAGLAFEGSQGQPYSILNHNISELGKPAVSELAGLFNAGLQLGGALLALFAVGLGAYVRRPGLRLAALAGVVTACGVLAVGAFPLQEWRAHKIAAGVFFFGGFATMVLCTASLLISGGGRLPSWLVLPSSLGALNYAVALALPGVLYRRPLQAFIAGPTDPGRPVLWLPSLLEWSVLLTTLTWVLLVAAALCRHAHDQAWVTVREGEAGTR